MAYVTISGREDIEQREEKSGNTVYVFRRKIVTTYARQLSVNASFTPATPTQIYGSENLTRVTDYSWEFDEITKLVTEYKTTVKQGPWQHADTYEIAAAPDPE